MTVMTVVSLGVREDAGVELELLEDGPSASAGKKVRAPTIRMVRSAAR